MRKIHSMCLITLIVFLFVSSCTNGDPLLDFVGEFMHSATSSFEGPLSQFGESVAISGDYAIVGALRENNYTGAAYIFKRDDDRWGQQQRIQGSDGSTTHDFYGTSVSINDEYAIVGSWWDDTNGENNGAAYIYKRTNDVWQEESVLLPDQENTFFGMAVSISGDYAIIGASDYNDVGAAYIFHREGAQWIQQEILYPPYPISGSNFGSSVSIDGSYAIIGAETYENHGKVFIYEKNEENWILKNTFDGETNSNFGSSVSIDGPFAIVGAPNQNNNNGTKAGSVHIYKRIDNEPGSQWMEDSIFIANDGENYDNFGYSVSIYAKSELGGYIIVGAKSDDNEQGEHAGAAYVLITVNSEWTHLKKLMPSPGSDYDIFGSAVSINGNNAIIGAPGMNNSTGCVYFFK